MNKEEEKEEIRLSFNTLVTAFVAAIFLLAAFQTIQLSGLRADVLEQKTFLASLKAQPATSLAQASTPAQSTGIPPSLQNIPDMVGGC